LISNDKNRIRLTVLGPSQDGACTDLFENLRENSLKRDLSNDTAFNKPLLSLVNTFKKLLFYKILLPQTVSAVCRSINKNKKTNSSKDKSTGSYKSRDSLETFRRTYQERDTEMAQGEPYASLLTTVFCMGRL
jgi:hypothetical protein